jgi:hypothetical protein
MIKKTMTCSSYWNSSCGQLGYGLNYLNGAYGYPYAYGAYGGLYGGIGACNLGCGYPGVYGAGLLGCGLGLGLGNCGYNGLYGLGNCGYNGLYGLGNCGGLNACGPLAGLGSEYPYYACSLPLYNAVYPYWGLGTSCGYNLGYQNCYFPFLNQAYFPWYNNHTTSTFNVPSKRCKTVCN